jgi:hypothetical protein
MRGSRLLLALLLSWTCPGAHASPEGGAPRGSPRLSAQIASVCAGASVVILGERHREPDSHALFLDLVNAFVSQGDRVFVGLEIGSDHQSDLEAAATGPWPSNDLVPPAIDSASYRDLVRALLRLAGRKDARVTVRAIDAPRGSRRDRDGEMAAQIGAALQSGSCDRVLVLAGNLHALKQVPWAPAVAQPPTKLAGLLKERGVGVASVVQEFGGSCGEAAKATFYPAGSEAASNAVRSLWDTLHTDLSQGGPRACDAADGAVCWTCAP